MKSNFGIQPWTLVDLHNVINIFKNHRQVELKHLSIVMDDVQKSIPT